jgi:hypothetical protein
VESFLKELAPRQGEIAARFGSWYTLMIMQYGFDKTLFEKKLSKTSFDTSQLVGIGKNYIQPSGKRFACCLFFHFRGFYSPDYLCGSVEPMDTEEKYLIYHSRI